MSKIGEQFSEFRKTAPKYVQWILLVAAIVIVVVLLMLLVGGRKAQRVTIAPDSLSPAPELIITPDGPVDWSDTLVGEVRETEFYVTANTRVQVTNVIVRVEGGGTNDAAGITAIETCKNDQTIIDKDISCMINIKFRPEHPITTRDANVAITWTAFDSGGLYDNPKAITLVIGAHEKANHGIVQQESQNVEEPDTNENYGYGYDHDSSDFKNDLDNIAAPIDFDTEPQYDLPEVDIPDVNLPTINPMKAFKNNCSDFAFPGYNTAGIQSGWIKPEGGMYKYHPFSDVNCDTPTGIYNADTGYIMDIRNPSRKIGSDSEHIRFVVQDRLPQLSGGSTRRTVVRAEPWVAPMDQQTIAELPTYDASENAAQNGYNRVKLKAAKTKKEFDGYKNAPGVVASRPRDRSFVLRQYKPIPATIVSDIQADANLLKSGLPVRATVDRNVYSDNGRTVIIPTGTLMLGYVTGELPGPYKAVGRMEIKWYQFIRPDGVEFNFVDTGDQPFAADTQGRKGVPGHGSTDYLQQFVMPMLTAIVPAAVNMIAPISDAFVNQIDLDNNTVVQSGTVRSSELAKNEIITAWNNVATKLLVDLMDNTTPPFSIAAGTRITVFSPVDLFVTCGDEDGRRCAIRPYADDTSTGFQRGTKDDIDYDQYVTTNLEELVGQVRSMLAQNIKEKWCEKGADGITWYAKTDQTSRDRMNKEGYSFTTVDFYCRSFGTYNAINNAKQQAIFENQKDSQNSNSVASTGGTGTKAYNEQVLGLKYNEDGSIQNPFKKPAAAKTPANDTSVVSCDGGMAPDANGCCPGETYTDMGEQGFNCCPDAGGDCFPPIEL